MTVVPVGPPGPPRADDLARAVPHLPLAGVVVGSAVCAVLWAPVPVPAGVRAALALTGWLLLTGMLHLDGLLDSADALLAPVSVERRLAILSDVRVGAFGFGVGAATLLALWSVLAERPPWWSVIVVAVAARFAVTGPLAVLPPARPGGLGAAARAAGWWWGVAYVLPLLALPLLDPRAWPQVPAAIVTILVVTWAGAWWASRRLGGGITGDVAGALVMVAELAGLLCFVVG